MSKGRGNGSAATEKTQVTVTKDEHDHRVLRNRAKTFHRKQGVKETTGQRSTTRTPLGQT